MAFSKIKNFGSAKYLIKRIKREATDWEEIFANHKLNKRLVSRICKKL